MHKAEGRSFARMWGWSSLGAIFVLWFGVATVTPLGLLPDPVMTAAAMVDVLIGPDPEGEFAYVHIGLTLVRVATAFALAVVVGTTVGLAMGLRKAVERAVAPVLPIWMSFPTLLVVFLTILWVGRGDVGAIAAVAAVVTPYVIVNVWSGAAAMDKGLIQMAVAFRAPHKTLIRKVYLPQLLPSIFSSFRYAFSFGWKLVVLFETFGVRQGIGYQFTFWFEMQQVDKMLAWVIIFGVIMFTLEYGVLTRLERRAFAWRREAVFNA